MNRERFLKELRSFVKLFGLLLMLLLLLLHCLLPLTDLEEKLEVGKGELVTSLDTSSGEQQCRGGNSW